MKMKDAYERIVKEYLSKLTACDECIAEYFCIEYGLKKARVPQDKCESNLKDYLQQLQTPTITEKGRDNVYGGCEDIRE